MTPSSPMTCPLCHSTNVEKKVTDNWEFYICHGCQWKFGEGGRRERRSGGDRRSGGERQSGSESPDSPTKKP